MDMILGIGIFLHGLSLLLDRFEPCHCRVCKHMARIDLWKDLTFQFAPAESYRLYASIALICTGTGTAFGLLSLMWCIAAEAVFWAGIITFARG
jgi:hypothetical protein